MTRLTIKYYYDQRIKSRFLNVACDAVGVKMQILLFN
jgi:ribosomal protein S27E